ncbi:uncharacterized protein LOC126991542 [Eriocheir sinensis]|uniref:uncharacterized protein LOC126991542 n=1 Tax=Eriocheir sinensis TaxID=95602 RepID=UPI0021C7FAA1|nr:uncharacterized protein LOC126991542 [Eriocheir sinensis]
MTLGIIKVQCFFLSPQCYHVMRDNPFHAAAILAGLFGGCTSWRHSVAEAARDAAFCEPHGPGGDQHILRSLVWPAAQHNVTMHDSFRCHKYPTALPFPTRRVNFTFVGMRSYRKMYRWERLTAECPRACRPKEHPDWTQC